MPRSARFLTAIMAVLLFSAAGFADEKPVANAVLIELNATKSGPDSCSLTFLILNGHAEPIERAVYETVLFDGAGQVDRLTLFDFGTLPPGRPRVRQFSVSELTCDGLGQILINGAHTCEATKLPNTACETGLTTGTRVDIKVTG